MAERRKYTKRQKLAAVMAAELSGVTEAAKQSGIPKTSIHYWLTRPEFAQFRTKTREELAAEVKVVAHLAWQRTAEALHAGTLEPRDVLFAAEKATNLQLLMSGDVTHRVETRSVTDDLPADVKRALRDRLARLAAEEATAGAPQRVVDEADAGVDTGAPSGPA